MNYKAMFSVGDYKLANFAEKPLTKGKLKELSTIPGVRKGYIRNVGGKAVSVGQSILKAGTNTAGKLGTTAKDWGGKGLGVGRKGLTGAKTLAGQGIGAATSYVGRGGEVIAKNPKASLLVAGTGAVAAGATGYMNSRPKRNRR